MKKYLLFLLILSGAGPLLNTANAQDDSQKIILEFKKGKSWHYNPNNAKSKEGILIDPQDIKSISITGGSHTGHTRFTYRLDGDTVIISGSPLLFSDRGFNVSKKEEPSAALGVAVTDGINGAKIEEVVPGSPADKAGLRKGDLLTNVDKQKVTSASSLTEIISKLNPRHPAQISLNRDGKKSQVIAILGKAEPKYFLSDTMPIFQLSPSDDSIPMLRLYLDGDRMPNLYEHFKRPNQTFQFSLPQRRGNIFSSPSRSKLGLQIQDTEDDSGVTVLKITPKSPAETGGLKEGDLITEINGNKITNVTDAQKAIRETKGDQYKMEVLRDNKKVIITVSIPKVLRKADL